LKQIDISPPGSSGQKSESTPSKAWSCTNCSLLNPGHTSVCEKCGTTR
jgi:membrane protease subunit (stomatin/prohibitin family)